MVVQDDQSITKSAYIICWSGAPKYFHILTMGLSNCPSYFSLLPLVLSNCPTYFIMFLLVSSNCSAYFSMLLCFVHDVFKTISSFLALTFVTFSPVFSEQFQKAVSIQKCTSGAWSDRLPFFGLYIQCFVTLTVLVFFSIIFPEMAIQDYNLYQYTTNSAYICRSGAPPCGMLPVPKPPIWLMAFFDHHKNWVWNFDPWHGQQVDPQRLIVEKIWTKTGLICSNPLITQENQLWTILGLSKKCEKKG